MADPALAKAVAANTVALTRARSRSSTRVGAAAVRDLEAEQTALIRRALDRRDARALSVAPPADVARIVGRSLQSLTDLGSTSALAGIDRARRGGG